MLQLFTWKETSPALLQHFLPFSFPLAWLSDQEAACLVAQIVVGREGTLLATSPSAASHGHGSGLANAVMIN